MATSIKLWRVCCQLIQYCCRWRWACGVVLSLESVPYLPSVVLLFLKGEVINLIFNCWIMLLSWCFVNHKWHLDTYVNSAVFLKSLYASSSFGSLFLQCRVIFFILGCWTPGCFKLSPSNLFQHRHTMISMIKCCFK